MLLESSLNDLFRSAVVAFPETRKRQHATDTVRIVQLSWTPYIGVKTLFLRGLAENRRGGGGEYRPIILFKGVQYSDDGEVKVVADGKFYRFAQLSESDNDALVRCDCGDFYWRFNYYDHLDKSLYGNKRKKYEGEMPINPTKSPGMCKHLMKMMYALRDAGVIN